MKRLVRSIIDPSPRTVSLKGLTAVVGMLLCGIGISVHEYLESGRPAVRAATPVGYEAGACRRDPCRAPAEVLLPAEEQADASRWTGGEGEASPSRTTANASAPAATQWIPENDSPAEDHEDAPAEARSECGNSRIGTISGQ